MTEQNKAVEAALPDSFSRKVSRATDDVLAHVERVCGDLSRSPTVIEFDDDYSVLRHNIYAVIGLAFRDNHERLDALSRSTQTADAVEGGVLCEHPEYGAELEHAGHRLTSADYADGWTQTILYKPSSTAALSHTATSEATPTHDSGLQSNSDSELLREVADRAAEFVAACKPMIYPKPDKPETDYGRMVALEEALARLEQGAA